MMKTHTLNNGAKIVSLSPHGFKFSDGSESDPQNNELVSFFTLERKFQSKGEIKGMAVNAMQMVLSNDQIKKLQEIAAQVDLIIVPFPMLTALREQGIRNEFPNAVAFNATAETQRCPPQEKVVDLNNWSY